MGPGVLCISSDVPELAKRGPLLSAGRSATEYDRFAQISRPDCLRPVQTHHNHVPSAPELSP